MGYGIKVKKTMLATIQTGTTVILDKPLLWMDPGFNSLQKFVYISESWIKLFVFI